MRSKNSLTNSLIIVISICFLIATYYPNLTNPPVIEQLFLIKKAILSDGVVHGVATGQWYRLLTVALTHGGWTHLIFNMLALFTVGNPVEVFYGRARFAIIFLVSLVNGSGLPKCRWSDCGEFANYLHGPWNRLACTRWRVVRRGGYDLFNKGDEVKVIHKSYPLCGELHRCYSNLSKCNGLKVSFNANELRA
jgi:hypothetical protein